MPDSGATELRIYCICGQKMRVSAEMFGRPGKCIACRQKIRIPTLEEMPDGSTDLHLKDHPEFLRKVKVPSEQDRADEVAPPPASEDGQLNSVPLDVLDDLRMLASLDKKVRSRLKKLEDDDSSEADRKRADLEKNLKKIAAAREDLDEEMRQRLMETAIELTNVLEKIAELGLAVRVGEINYGDYHEDVTRLRRQRDRLERRQENLRGWLTVDDPFMAGGYIDVPLNRIPKGGYRLTFPPETEASVMLMDWHIQGLRGALELRADAERRYTEAKQDRASGAITASRLLAVRLQSEADNKRARAEIAFRRSRLEQLEKDYGQDIQAVDAQMALARGQVQTAEIRRERFNQLEAEYLRTKQDLTKARALVARALNANSAQDVPHPRGTFIQRLAHAGGELPVAVDAWLGWAGATLMVVAVLLPVAGGMSALAVVSGVEGSGLAPVAFPLLLAVVLTCVAFLRSSKTRGLILTGAWFIGAVTVAAYLKETQYLEGPVGERFREGGALFLRPGVLLYAMGSLLVALAALVALVKQPGWLFAPIGAIALGLLIVILVGTDFFGTRAPVAQFQISPSRIQGSNDYKTGITIRNRGGRALVLIRGMDTTQRNAFDVLVERRIGQNSWAPVESQPEVRAPDRTYLSGPLPASISLAPDESASLTYRMSADEYRVLLHSTHHDKTFRTAFRLEAPEDAVVDTPGGESGAAGTESDSENPPALPEELLRAVTAQVELVSVLGGANREPKFGMRLSLPSGKEFMNNFGLGDEIYDGWTVSEFNPIDNTVTVEKDGTLLILRRRSPVFLSPNPVE